MGGCIDNFADIGNEAHIQHAVCLIDNEHFDPGKIHEFLVFKIDESPWCSNNDINRACNAFFLFVVTCSPIKGDNFVWGKFAEVPGIFFNLKGQLPGRSKDQGTGIAFFRPTAHGFFCHLGNDGNEKCSTFTRPCLGFADGISPFKGFGKRPRLNGGGVLKSKFCNSLHQLNRQVKVVKSDLTLFFRDLKIRQIPCGPSGCPFGYGFLWLFVLGRLLVFYWTLIARRALGLCLW